MAAPRVVVVGAGVIGLFCALRLAEEGLRVTVLEALSEKEMVRGRNASLSAAGMLAPHTETAQHPDFAELCKASFALWRERVRGALWEAFVTFDGADVVAASDGSSRTIDEEGVVDTVRVYQGLITDASRRDVSLLYEYEVDDGVMPGMVRRPHDVVEADYVVLAPGASMNDYVLPYVPVLKHVAPAKGHVVNVELARALLRTLHTPDFYIAKRWDDVCVLGATMEIGRDDCDVEQEKVDGLLAAANAHFGGGVRQAGEAWAGVRAMSPDSAPMIGPTELGLAAGCFIAAGHSRNGWLLAPITAEIICAYVMGKDIPRLWAAFHPDRFDQ